MPELPEVQTTVNGLQLIINKHIVSIKINTINMKGKTKLVRNKMTFKSGYKKAIVTLKKGQSIDLATGI